MIAVIFHPLGLNPFVRCSMSELYNHYIDVEDLEDIELNHLKRNISAEPAVETCIRLIERFFMQRIGSVQIVTTKELITLSVKSSINPPN